MFWTSGIAAVIFFGLGMFFHNYKINHAFEIAFLSLALTFTFSFDFILHKQNKNFAAIFTSAAAAIIFFSFGMFFHDYETSRPLEVAFFASSLASSLYFVFLLHK